MVHQAEVRWGRGFDFTSFQMKAPPLADHTYALYMFIEDLGGNSAAELIYIGIVKSDRRDLLTRLNEHRKRWLGKVAKGQISARFGWVYTTHRATGQLLEDIESVLIFGAQPRENTSKKNSFSLYDDIVVTNRGAGRYLAKRYSSAQLRANGS